MSDVRGTSEDKIVHQYDDILEADNILPRWWLFVLFGTIVFAACYWIAVEILHAAPTPLEAYRIDKTEAAAEEDARLLAEGPLTAEKLLAMSKTETVLASGKVTFQTICAACHGQNAGGTVGPNLTDKFWLHGGKPEEIVQTVRKGWPEKGMPPWGPQLGEKKVRAVAAYVLSIKNTNVAGGKAPQGDPEGT